MVPAPISPPPTHPSRGGGQAVRGGGQAIRGGGQSVRGHPRGGGQSDGAQPPFYAFLARPEADSSNAVITGIVTVCHRYASILFDLGSTYSYVSSYFASYMVMPRDSLIAFVYVSTFVGDSIMVDHVYRSCVVSIGSYETMVDLLLLDMVDSDVILGMDWLSPYYAILDCHAKTVTLSMPKLPRLEWRGTSGHSTSRVNSYMKARCMVENGCLVYLAYIYDPSAEVPSMDSVLVVRKFPEVFPIDLSGKPPDRDIDLCIDLVPGTQPISTTPYCMDPVELKELK
ncbi:uncharacterized protein [Nicotiana tomentosiformis]|uniref:uncharacterized protein n=1 Tax=Nicotiana tomentosiformis TaxID=4098 RepID=UPI00388C5ADA